MNQIIAPNAVLIFQKFKLADVSKISLFYQFFFESHRKTFPTLHPYCANSRCAALGKSKSELSNDKNTIFFAKFQFIFQHSRLLALLSKAFRRTLATNSAQNQVLCCQPC